MKMDSEAQIYEDISKFIQIFKKCLAFLESIIQNAKKKDQLIVYIEKQKKYLHQLLCLAQKYSPLNDSLNIDQSTFSRFCNRLIETICLLKTQLSSSANSEPIFYLSELFKNLEKTVNKNQEEKKFKQLIVDTYWLFLNACLKLEQLFLIQKSIATSHSEEKTNQKVLEILQGKKRENFKNDENAVFCRLSNNGTQQNKKANESKPEISKITKTMGLINSRYETLKCLDIDYQYFKTSTFEAIQKSAQFQKQYLTRNEESGKFVKHYHDDFNLFLKKRELKISRKNKKVVLETDYDYNLASVNSAIQEFKEKKGYIKLLRGKLNKTLNQRTLVENLNKSKQDQAAKKQQFKKTNINSSSKTLYSVKNMFLIFGKKNNKSLDKKVKHNDKQDQKKVLQTHSINLSVFTEDSYKSSPGLRQKAPKQHLYIKETKRESDGQGILNEKQKQLNTDQDDYRLQEDSLICNPRKKINKTRQFEVSFEKNITQASQFQNYAFKIQRTIKYRSKLEPKLRNIIFKSKQI